MLIMADICAGYGMHSCFGPAALQNSRLEAFSSCYVHWYGLVGCNTGGRRTASLQPGGDAATDGSRLGYFAGLSIHLWSCAICGKLSRLILQEQTADTDQLRWPERQYPGKVDLVGSSHQIFHVFVVLAAMSHLRGLLVAFDYRHGGNGATCP